MNHQAIIYESVVERREFSAYCDGNDRCILKENGISVAHRVGEVSAAIDFILNLDLALRSPLSVYDPSDALFRILV